MYAAGETEDDLTTLLPRSQKRFSRWPQMRYCHHFEAAAAIIMTIYYIHSIEADDQEKITDALVAGILIVIACLPFPNIFFKTEFFAPLFTEDCVNESI